MKTLWAAMHYPVLVVATQTWATAKSESEGDYVR
jgi:hypothetical protein